MATHLKIKTSDSNPNCHHYKYYPIFSVVLDLKDDVKMNEKTNTNTNSVLSIIHNGKTITKFDINKSEAISDEEHIYKYLSDNKIFCTIQGFVPQYPKIIGPA